MRKDVMFCHKYLHLSRCQGYIHGRCNQCYKYDTVEIAVCDKCGIELDDEDYTFDGSPELCPDCKSRKEKESYVTV